MQIQKEGIRKTILEVTREEFIKNGFKNTSMRTIAQKADVSLSNIYNYFKNKDEIFKEVLSPVISALENLTNSHNNEESLNIDVFTSQDYLRNRTILFVELILKYRDELRVLFFKSHGSELEKFKEYYIQKNTDIGLEYLQLMKKKYPELNIAISDFFIHAMTSWWLNTINELIMHNLTREELEEFLTEYMNYSSGGWKNLMHVETPINLTPVAIEDENISV